MIKFVEYLSIFVAVVLFQVLLFNNIYIGNIMIINISALFIIMLPFKTPGWFVIILSALLGVVMDMFSGLPAINTIANTAVGFMRCTLIPLTLGRGEETLRGVISSNRLSVIRYLTFIVILIFTQNSIIFLLEALSLDNITHLLMRITASSIVSIFFVYLLQLPLYKKER